MALKKKTKNALMPRTFTGQDGNTYLVFRPVDNSFHAFLVVAAKEVAPQCGAAKGANARQCGSPFGTTSDWPPNAGAANVALHVPDARCLRRVS